MHGQPQRSRALKSTKARAALLLNGADDPILVFDDPKPSRSTQSTLVITALGALAALERAFLFSTSNLL